MDMRMWAGDWVCVVGGWICVCGRVWAGVYMQHVTCPAEHMVCWNMYIYTMCVSSSV